MTPHIAWAFRQRDMTASQRLVLIALAERANGEMVCFPSFDLIAEDCEISRRAAAAAVHFLAVERGLVSFVTDPAERAAIFAKAGKRRNLDVNIYRINRPEMPNGSAENAPLSSAKSAPHCSAENARGAKSAPGRSAKSARGRSATIAPRVVQNFPGRSATIALEPLNESLKLPLQAPQAREASKEIEEMEATAPPPAPPRKPPEHGTTTDGIRHHTEAPALAARSSDAFLRDPSPDDALPKAEADAITVDPEEQARIAAQLAALVQTMTRKLQRNFPPRLSALTTDEMREIVTPRRDQARYLNGAELAAARRIAGIAARPADA